MKVAFFIGSLNRGGTETLVLDVFRRKDILPFESILIYRNDGNLTDDYRSTGIPMFCVKPHGLKIRYIWHLRKIIKYEGVDILHSQTLLNSFLGIFCVCGLRHTKLVASFHGFFPSFKDRVLSHLVMWFADASIFVSEYVYKWYHQNTFFAPKNRCHVVYNGSDFSKFDKQYPCPDFLKDDVSVSQEQRVNLAMVGSFVSGRSQDFLCKCLKRLRDVGIDNFRFYFVGKRSISEPQRFDQCVEYCKKNGLMDRVFFLGGRSDVPAILSHIDGFVYSTNNDTFGIAVVEAMAVGIPVIVNDWEVMKEITRNGQWATLYKTKDEVDCVSKLSSLIPRGSERLKSCTDTAASVRAFFCIENHIKALFQVYEKALI